MRGCDKLTNITSSMHNKSEASFMYFVIKYMIKWTIHIVSLNPSLRPSDNTLHHINMAPQLFDPPYLFLWIKWHCRPGHGGEIFLETGLIFVPADKHYLQIVARFFPVFIKIDQQRGKVPARGTPVCREIKAHHAPRPTERPHGHLLQAIPSLTEYMGPE